MPTASPKVSFVTVSYKNPGLIRQLLKGFEQAQLAFPYEYFMVDNAVGDGTGTMVRERFPWVTMIDSPGNVGFGVGNNIGFQQAQGEYVMLINPDLTIFPGELEKLVAFADAHPDVGLVGPKVLNPDGSLQRSFHRFPGLLIPLLRRTFLGKTTWGKKMVQDYFMQDADPDKVQEVDGLFGAAILIRRKALDQIGFFDQRFFMYFEDTDLCRRAWEKGWRVVYAPLASVTHYHQRESNVKHVWDMVMNRVARIHIKSGFLYFFKYWGKPHPHRVSHDVLS